MVALVCGRSSPARLNSYIDSTSLPPLQRYDLEHFFSDVIRNLIGTYTHSFAVNQPPAFNPPSLNETVQGYVRGGGGYIFLLDPDGDMVSSAKA